MLEIEVKCPVANFDAVQQRLTAWTPGPIQRRSRPTITTTLPTATSARPIEAIRLRRVGAKSRHL